MVREDRGGSTQDGHRWAVLLGVSPRRFATALMGVPTGPGCSSEEAPGSTTLAAQLTPAADNDGGRREGRVSSGVIDLAGASTASEDQEPDASQRGRRGWLLVRDGDPRPVWTTDANVVGVTPANSGVNAGLVTEWRLPDTSTRSISGWRSTMCARGRSVESGLLPVSARIGGLRRGGRPAPTPCTIRRLLHSLPKWTPADRVQPTDPQGDRRSEAG